MHEATLRIEDHGPYAASTRDADTRIELWCNDHCDLLHVTGSSDRALDRVEDAVGIRDGLAEGDDRVVITGDCLQRHEETVEQYLERHNCLLLPPLTYANGAKHCRVLALDPANLTAVYRDLAADHDVTVAEKHEFTTLTRDAPILSLDGVVPSLTARQRDVLRAAHRAGYYRIPRETTTEELAETFGLDRRTVEEHLRRAENKILGALVDHGVV
ncbi:helix-turn-helix domain-containing protein [Halobacterium zhouii]|uniref:helix-turn-helix domain-containing protein n=1 Tax=Halobacterium zhouii TaxID=2902624 RepID=UPI001E3F8D84|nr:helix-turn-helix domain-containing protein [Halobacterium zhouii]